MSREDSLEGSGEATVFGLLFVALMLSGACSNRSVETEPGSATVSPASGVMASGNLENVLSRGAELYVANCQICHGDRQGNGVTLGAAPHNESGHTWHHPDAQLKKETIFNGKMGLGLMPPFKDKLTEGEVDAILSYIKTWWEEWQREGQADISQEIPGGDRQAEERSVRGLYHQQRRTFLLGRQWAGRGLVQGAAKAFRFEYR